MKNKTFIICAKEEYEFLSEHLYEILNGDKFIRPYEFATFMDIENNLIKKAHFNKFNLSFKKALFLFKNMWYENKLNHFINNIEKANKVIILENDLFTLDDFDMEEKRFEIAEAKRLNIPRQEIKMSSLSKCKKLKYPQN